MAALKVAVFYNREKRKTINLFGRPNRETIGLQTEERNMAQKKPSRKQQDQFEELQEQDFEDELDEVEREKARRDSGVSRHRSRDRDKRSGDEQ